MALDYLSTSKPTSLAVAMDNATTSATLVDGSSYPDPVLIGKQYTVIIGYGTDREEVCTVTAKANTNTLTLLRGQDGTPALAKNIGDIVVHGVSARDFKRIDALDTGMATANAAIDALEAGKLDLAGGTMTGSLLLKGNAVDPLEATPLGQMESAIGLAMPIGTIIAYGGSVVPNAAWHLCDGTAHGSTALQEVLGGSLVTPDLRDRFVIAAGPGYPRTTTGGAATVVLTAAQSGLPAHDHGVTVGNDSPDHRHRVNPGSTTTSSDSHSHTLTIREGTGSGDGSYLDTNPTDSGKNVPLPGAYTSTDSHNHTVDIAEFDSGYASARHSHSVDVLANTAVNAAQAHNNMPPYYSLVMIIKKA